jgi:diguanylate cyclase (GGDEF)-like protein/PAS domain S-box-containing protein
MTEDVSKADAFTSALIEHSEDLLVVVNGDGVLTYASPAARRMLGYEPADILGTNAFELVHPDDQIGALEGFESTLSSHDSRATPLLLRLRRSDGVWLDTEVIATNHLNDPTICGLLLTIRDVSASMRTDAALRQSEEHYRLIVELAQEGIWSVDRDARITYANRALAHMLGTTVAELVGRSIYDFLDAEDANAARHFGARHTAADGAHELRLITKDGRRLWTRVTASPLRLPGGVYNGALALVTDVTEQRALEQRLQYDARHDALTGVANRHALFDILDGALRAHDRCAVLFADLDHFKNVNDTYGHQAGDEILRAVANRISSGIRPTDTVARVGGDEFVVVGTPLQQDHDVVALGARIPQALKDPVRTQRATVPVNVSIGIAVATDDDNVDSILARADNALYRAKHAGRGRIEIASSR